MRAGLSALLIPDECGQRALEETLVDWRQERARAESAFGRAGADLRGLAGVARVGAMTVGAGLVRPDVWSCFTWTMIAGAIASATLVLLTAWPLKFTVTNVLLLVPAPMVVLCGFAAAFGLGLPRSRSVPGLALCVLMLVTTAGLASFVVPKANEIFRQQFFVQSLEDARTARTGLAPSGIPEQNSAELLRRAMSDESGAALRALLQRCALFLSPVALLLLGAAFRARFSEARAWRLVQVTSGVVAVGTFIATAAASVVIHNWLTGLRTSGAHTFPWWSAIAVSLTVTLWLSRPPSPFRLRRGKPANPRT